VGGSLLMGLGVLGVGWVMGVNADQAGWGRAVVAVVLMTMTGAVVYGLWSIWTKMDELGWLIAKTTDVRPASDLTRKERDDEG